MNLSFCFFMAGVVFVAAGPVLALFGGHPFYGFLMWIIGLSLQACCFQSKECAPGISLIEALAALVLGLFGGVHSLNFGQGLYGLVTFIMLFLGIFSESEKT